MSACLYHPIQYMNLLASYRNYVVQPSDPVYGIVWEFYEFDTSDIAEGGLMCLPDACPDMIFTLQAEKVYALGCFKTAVLHTFPINSKIFGIRFVTGAFNQVSTIPIKTFLGTEVDLCDEDARIASFHETLIEAPSFMTRVQAGMQFVLARYKPDDGCQLIHWMVDEIVRSKGNMPIRTLAETVHYSERYLRQQFNRYVGQSPKQFSDIVRFQMTIRHFVNEQDENIEELAFQSGYYDTAHMTKMFKQLTGCAPGSFLDSLSKVRAETI